jgi:hypothetical protein
MSLTVVTDTHPACGTVILFYAFKAGFKVMDEPDLKEV